jgi:hypothetical protein
MTGFCEHGNEPSGFIKGREFLDQVRDYRLLKKAGASLTYIFNCRVNINFK